MNPTEQSKTTEHPGWKNNEEQLAPPKGNRGWRKQLGRIAQLEDRVRSLLAMMDEARLDDLTKLLRKQDWFDDMSERMARGESVVVVQFDLDHFKEVNDTFGHQVGDEVLRRFGQYLGMYFRRASDAVAHEHTDDAAIEGTSSRLGGDEFGLTLSGALGDVSQRVEAMRAAFLAEMWQRYPQLGPEATAKPLGVSYGAIQRHPSELPLTPEALAHLADQAMYAAKTAGKSALQPSGEV